jgi:hypothetical protein
VRSYNVRIDLFNISKEIVYNVIVEQPGRVFIYVGGGSAW